MKRIATVTLLLLLTTACGSSSGGSGSGSSGPTTAGTSSTGAPATTTPADAGGSDGDNPVDGTTFCAFLAKEEPKLKGAGAAAGAKAFFAIDLANWIGEHPDQKPRTAADLDNASRKTCPKSRSAVVAAMGAASFDEALG